MKKIKFAVLSFFVMSVCYSAAYALSGPINPANADQVAELKQEADAGDRGAQYDMSMVYEFKQDQANSLKYLKMSAEAGYGKAQYTLANMYYSGTGGVSKNYAQAEKWYTASKESGYAGKNVDVLIADSKAKATLAASQPVKTAKTKVETVKTKAVAAKTKATSSVSSAKTKTAQTAQTVTAKATEKQTEVKKFVDTHKQNIFNAVTTAISTQTATK